MLFIPTETVLQASEHGSVTPDTFGSQLPMALRVYRNGQLRCRGMASLLPESSRRYDAREALNEGSAFAEKSNARLDNVLKVGSRIAERLISSPDDVKVDAGGAAHPDCCRGTCAEINRAAPNERSAIIDPHYH